MGKAGKLALKAAAKAMSTEKGLEFDMDGLNGFRDWDIIRSFTESFADNL